MSPSKSKMFKIRLNHRRISLWILLFIQILLIMSYFYLQIDKGSDLNNLDTQKITFVGDTSNNKKQGAVVETPNLTYHTANSRIFLRSVSTRHSFVDFNSSLCYMNGTDLVSMKRNMNLNWQCTCLPGWHGKDCGQPEVIWRAFLTYRRPMKFMELRKFQRRILYFFELNKFSEPVVDIRVNELRDVVDLFVIYENYSGLDYTKNQLAHSFLKNYHSKILYLKTKTVKELWQITQQVVRNLRNDDIILTSQTYEIQNKFALNFLKFYNHWPEPLRFRLRWSVFGFFWIHPAKTVITGGACTMQYLRDILSSKLEALSNNKTLSNPLYKGIILGDLNHYGGWYCEFCHESVQILESLSQKNVCQIIDCKKLEKEKIDVNYIEDKIENGLYIDGRTELIRAHKYNDNYFAPYSLLENSGKYDNLLVNFYSKMDYYDG